LGFKTFFFHCIWALLTETISVHLMMYNVFPGACTVSLLSVRTISGFPDQCLNGTPNVRDYRQQSHTGGHTYDDTMDARQCLICITSSDWMSGCTVGRKEAMAPFCHEIKGPHRGENGMLGPKQMAMDL
uniref:Uncharacterized protein n=1 Tax=Amphiprion ocellaris TaxID=80972 RepID=A0AAQ5YGD0_AMPOC